MNLLEGLQPNPKPTPQAMAVLRSVLVTLGKINKAYELVAVRSVEERDSYAVITVVLRGPVTVQTDRFILHYDMVKTPDPVAAAAAYVKGSYREILRREIAEMESSLAKARDELNRVDQL